MTNEELASKIKSGETELLITLWEQVQKLVIKIIFQRYLPRDGSTNKVELDDLLQAGFIGMMNAVRDFNPSSGFQFNTYLDKHLANTVREALGIRTSKRDPLLDALSMDKPLDKNEDSNPTLADTMQDKKSRYVYDDLIEKLSDQEDCRVILEQSKQLRPMEQEIFYERFLAGLTLRAIGEKHGFTRERAHQIVNKSLRNIRKSKAIQLIAKEYLIDRKTNFYARKGLKGFKTSFSSVVEDSVLRREIIRIRFGELVYKSVFEE
ncbi:RNA polymerase sigma factor, sigma-70 family [Desulfosporosinus acidiphilus SJ4]|uniref:RNA polymerase sigma factor, sigma-70 family n=1 Tax=Desulfosporosinus acidiphilus (strain DSM 22704 / JCM 16185 / SJ4) TaxID=646529 RepID=I4D821_DESAJ|nr:sigma-70 family RNA polymerase sigma factor [Desulfosporosinus acidiphilus]AFM41945.1 RNA polymerase sigma factor, sigma-70 family [Desulfosporosinus acidiphilus SJ4]